MNQFLTQLTSDGYIVPLGFAFFGSLVGLAGIFCHHWKEVRQAEMEAALKHKMLDQGMSADDIQKVLGASQTIGESSSGKTPPD